MTQQLAGGQRHWAEADIPDLSGRTAVVTGANTGLGLQTARVLAARGAHVVLACRNPDKAGHAAAQIAAAFPGASTSTVRLNLASQPSVRTAAEEIRARFPRVDLLINNGYPAVVESSARSHDEADQPRLWQVSEQLTGVAYATLG